MTEVSLSSVITVVFYLEVFKSLNIEISESGSYVGLHDG